MRAMSRSSAAAVIGELGSAGHRLDDLWPAG
jgi:hypothetical protein